jgi:Family of unknown function (DUF6173)
LLGAKVFGVLVRGSDGLHRAIKKKGCSFAAACDDDRNNSINDHRERPDNKSALARTTKRRRKMASDFGQSIEEMNRMNSLLGGHTLGKAQSNLDRAAEAMKEATRANRASGFYERLVAWINAFDADLDQEHEVGIRLVSFGQSVAFRLNDIGFWDPSLISFSGETDDGNPVELIQHVSQISVLLLKLPRKDPTKPKRPIGYTPDCGEAADANAEHQVNS